MPDDVRDERRRRLMDVQEDISAELLTAKIGREMEVLVDEVDAEEPSPALRRMRRKLTAWCSSMTSSMPKRAIFCACEWSIRTSMICMLKLQRTHPEAHEEINKRDAKK